MTLRQRVNFLCGQIGIMLLARFLFQWVLAFASPPRGSVLLPAAAVGSVLLLFRVLDGISDPLAGAMSDWWQRSGRERRRLLLYFLLLPGMGLVLCFSPTPGMTAVWRWVLLVSGFTLFFVGYTFYAIPYWSLVDDYSGGIESERRLLSTLLGVGLLLATAAAFLITPLLIDRLGYFRAALLVSFAAVGLMLLPYYSAPKRASAPASARAQPAFWRQVRNILAHRRFMAVLVVFIGSQMSLTIMTIASPYVAITLLGGTERDVAWLLGPLLAAALPSFCFLPLISRRFGWERATLGAALLLSLVYGACALFIGAESTGLSFDGAAVLFGCAGPMIAVLLGVEGEGITACAREAGGGSVSIYFGVYNLFVKAFNGLAIFIAGLLIAWADAGGGGLAVRGLIFSSGACLLLGLAARLLLWSRTTAGAD